MKSKNCLIYQPLGLGDIIWIQPIVDVMISEGYTVYYPVGSVYYDIVSQYIKKKNLIWVRESDDFPLKQYYGTVNFHQTEDELYIPVGYADRYLPVCPVMISKYYFLSIPISDYRKHFKLARDYQREQKLIDTYKLYGEYVLVNKSFGTDSKDRDIVPEVDSNTKVHVMNIEDDKKNGFHLFDWISALENASEIHTVETSICYLIDKYCTNKMYMYEKRQSDEENTYYKAINLVYRNSNWVYCN